MLRTYSDLRRLETFEERFRYLSLRGIVGDSTFGFDRYMNQMFYQSRDWRNVRHDVISRDNGCDLGVAGFEIHSKILIHHLNPMTPDDIKHGRREILDPQYLITTTLNTHNAIHFGDESKLRLPHKERRPGDTKLW